jgi:hypothetical protein
MKIFLTVIFLLLVAAATAHAFPYGAGGVINFLTNDSGTILTDDNGNPLLPQ